MFALTHGRIYTGHDVLDDHAVIIADGLIERVCPAAELPAGIETRDTGGAITPRAYRRAAERLRRRPVQRFAGSDFRKKRWRSCSAPTKIRLHQLSADADHQQRRIHEAQRRRDARLSEKAPKPGAGPAPEGPYLSPVKKGTHNPAFIRKPTQDMIDYLCANADVITKVTLAPEMVEPHVIKQLTEAGIVVSAGHSNATYDQARTGFAAGIASPPTCTTPCRISPAANRG